MPRIRTIKPEFWTSEKLATRLPGTDGRQARLLFIGLWNLAEDRTGVARGNPAFLKSALFAYDEDVSAADVARWLGILEAGRFIVRYQRDGSSYLWVRGFREHQRIEKPSAATLPEPSDAERAGCPPGSATTPGALPEPSRGEGKGKEGKVEEGIARVPRELPDEEMASSSISLGPPDAEDDVVAYVAVDARRQPPPRPLAGPSLWERICEAYRQRHGAKYREGRPGHPHRLDALPFGNLLALARAEVGPDGDAEGELLRRWAIALAWKGFPSCTNLGELEQHWTRYVSHQEAQSPEVAGRHVGGGAVSDGPCAGACGGLGLYESYGHRMCVRCTAELQQEVANFSPESVGAWVARRRAA